MPNIVSISTYQPPYVFNQDMTLALARKLFQDSFPDIDRLLSIFHNGQIEERHFSVPLEWFEKEHSLQDRNDIYITLATQFGAEAIKQCLQSPVFLKQQIPVEEIDAIIFISSSGISTPSIEARIMNKLPFSPHTKRIPIWGLGCAGGASGLSRAHDYCLAYPSAKVLVISIELCSLTFQIKDKSKSNLVGTSLFADGVACALIVGEEANIDQSSKLPAIPNIHAVQSTLLPNSEDVMGWDVKDDGLHVVFSKDIPQIVSSWLRPNIEQFLDRYSLSTKDIQHFIAHPGGRKVIEAYQKTLELEEGMTDISLDVLRKFGNMSSATVLYVLKRFMEKDIEQGHMGLITALGPGFSSELLLVEWQASVDEGGRVHVV
jgi:alkylresorcinol/alkylpyrone synthase